ncbi:hypothetical protein B0H14DRAFT_2642719 [Mycena olivaceomarginata]|nr:hypothetical protein B0H14DRAFT_2642719 [Mycena olivaceomarginata]
MASSAKVIGVRVRSSCYLADALFTDVGVQKALHLHLRILMGLLSPSAVPRRLSAEEMALFNARLASAVDVDARLTETLAAAIEPTAAVAERVTTFLRSARASHSQTSRDAMRVREDHLGMMFNALANAGIHIFTPDILGNPESLYNIAHELVALHSFRVVATTYGYSANLPYRPSHCQGRPHHTVSLPQLHIRSPEGLA